METTSMTNIETRSAGGVPNPVVYVLKRFKQFCLISIHYTLHTILNFNMRLLIFNTKDYQVKDMYYVLTKRYV